ncbi:MAG TPA: hypothetical protein VFT95_16970 [Micromonosporaceae bacterium]|nr:hypothetical protein [Micromonosporaceae bacterium]
MDDEDRTTAPPLTDDELAALRQAKFGALPARVRSTDMVETADTGPPHEEPPEPAVRREWG